jgi:hypothetical protein
MGCHLSGAQQRDGFAVAAVSGLVVGEQCATTGGYSARPGAPACCGNLGQMVTRGVGALLLASWAAASAGAYHAPTSRVRAGRRQRRSLPPPARTRRTAVHRRPVCYATAHKGGGYRRATTYPNGIGSRWPRQSGRFRFVVALLARVSKEAKGVRFGTSQNDSGPRTTFDFGTVRDGYQQLVL